MIEVARRFGENLVRIRERTGMSQEEVAGGLRFTAPRSAFWSEAHDFPELTPSSSSPPRWRFRPVICSKGSPGKSAASSAAGSVFQPPCRVARRGAAMTERSPRAGSGTFPVRCLLAGSDHHSAAAVESKSSLQ